MNHIRRLNTSALPVHIWACSQVKHSLAALNIAENKGSTLEKTYKKHSILYIIELYCNRCGCTVKWEVGVFKEIPALIIMLHSWFTIQVSRWHDRLTALQRGEQRITPDIVNSQWCRGAMIGSISERLYFSCLSDVAPIHRTHCPVSTPAPWCVFTS